MVVVVMMPMVVETTGVRICGGYESDCGDSSSDDDGGGGGGGCSSGHLIMISTTTTMK